MSGKDWAIWVLVILLVLALIAMAVFLSLWLNEQNTTPTLTQCTDRLSACQNELGFCNKGLRHCLNGKGCDQIIEQLIKCQTELAVCSEFEGQLKNELEQANRDMQVTEASLSVCRVEKEILQQEINQTLSTNFPVTIPIRFLDTHKKVYSPNGKYVTGIEGCSQLLKGSNQKNDHHAWLIKTNLSLGLSCHFSFQPDERKFSKLLNNEDQVSWLSIDNFYDIPIKNGTGLKLRVRDKEGNATGFTLVAPAGPWYLEISDVNGRIITRLHSATRR